MYACIHGAELRRESPFGRAAVRRWERVQPWMEDAAPICMLLEAARASRSGS